MGMLVPITRRKKLAPMSERTLSKAPRQLDLVLEDMRIRRMTPLEREAVLRSLALLIHEASGLVVREASDDQ